MTDPHTLPAPLDGLHLHKGWFPGVIGWVASEHGRYYAKHWGLGAVFEAKVAGALAELVLRYQPDTDLLLTLTDHERIVASITRGPVKASCAPGSAICTSPSIAYDASTPPEVGSDSTTM